MKAYLFAIIFSILLFNTLQEDTDLKISGAQLYMYGYPLVLTEITRSGLGVNNNQFIHYQSLANADSTNIVRPNRDTLYSLAFLDLSSSPVLLKTPDTHDRYFLVQVMDAWTNVIKSLGKRTTGTEAQSYVFVGPDYNGEIPEKYTDAVIKSPTNIVFIITRFQVDGESDIANVTALQDQLILKSFSSTSNLSFLQEEMVMTSDKKVGINADDYVDAMTAESFFTLFSTLLINNPMATADYLVITAHLAVLKLIPGKVWDSTKFSAEELVVLNESVEKARSMIVNAADLPSVDYNGWKIKTKIGEYGIQFLRRAVVAKYGYGANLPEDAVYATTSTGPNDTNLNGKSNYVLHFDAGEIPPVYAFWSVTLYNSSGFFVANTINRYGIGDSDDLKYNEDGSLDILIQAESPGSYLESNWLPAPQDEDFNLTMRLYWPDESIINNEWVPPAITSSSI